MMAAPNPKQVKITNVGENCHAVSLAELLLNKCTLASLGFTGAAHKCAVDFDNAQTPDARGGALRALLDACGIRRGPSDFLSTARSLAAACRGIGVYIAGFTILINDNPRVEGYVPLGEVQYLLGELGHWAAAAISAGNHVRYCVHLLVVLLPWSCICGHENEQSDTKCGSCDSPVLETRQNWNCPVCELLNPSSRAACGAPACGGRNPASATRASSKPAAAASATWACGACSFVNDGELPICEICENARGAPPAAPKPAARAADWACSACLFENREGALTCESCAAARPARPVCAPAAPAGWACDACLCKNREDALTCEMCAAARPASAAHSGWVCGTCKFENYAELPACEMCENARD